MRKPNTKISFNQKAVARMTAEQFIAHFRATYPDADLRAYAKELGLVSEPVADEAPAAFPAEGISLAPAVDTPAEDTTTSSKTSKPKGGKK